MSHSNGAAEDHSTSQMTDAIDLANGNDSHPISRDTLESGEVDEGRRTSLVYVSGRPRLFRVSSSYFLRVLVPRAAIHLHSTHPNARAPQVTLLGCPYTCPPTLDSCPLTNRPPLFLRSAFARNDLITDILSTTFATPSEATRTR